MLLRANALAKGYSGARVEVVELLLECLNRGVLPVVPSRGSVGRQRRPGSARPPRAAARRRGRGLGRRASGCPAARRSPRVGLEPLGSQAKEGLSLVNGTQFMAAVRRARPRARAPARRRGRHRLRALASRRCRARARASCRRSTRCARFRGQQASAANVLRLLEGSAIIEAHRWCDKVQDAYSLRCAPQVHGAVPRPARLRRLRRSRSELNAATDNPLVLVDEDELVSNGNFHGQPLAFALDALAIGGRGAGVASPSGASSGSSTRRCPRGCPPSSRSTAGSTPGS